MSKKAYPSTKFRVRLGHPNKPSAVWVGWRADEATARVAARWSFIAQFGYAPVFVGEARVYRDEPKRRLSPMMTAAILGMAMGGAMWNPTGRASLFRT